ncbi:hypothetical protein [Actinomadura sp. 9N215]|uniref:hypothetical protein n=1 Tax=Actinomadura sp. 9N215 TaxID=3375150 RepID=UPI0037B78F36
MSNGARHGLGVVIGLVVTPIIAACLMYGTTKLGQFARTFRFDGSDRWVGAGVMLIAAVLIGLAAGSRVSPLASLVPGVVYAFVGALWILAPRWSFEHAGRDVLPRDLRYGYLTLAPFGVFLVLGIALVVASIAPSRWQARTGVGAGPRYGAPPPPAPMGPPAMHGAPPPPPMGAHQPHQAHQAPPSPGQSPPPWQGTPQYGQAPAASNPPPLPPAPPPSERPKPSSGSRSDDDEPGEWTRMYGGNR